MVALSISAFFNDFEGFSSIDKVEFYVIAHSQAGLLTNQERAVNAAHGYT